MADSEPAITFDAGVLTLSGGQIPRQALDVVCAGGACRGATTLNLSDYRIRALGDELIVHIARSGAFPALRTLCLHDVTLSDAGVQTLADEALNLERLEHIDLGGARADDSISKEVIDALACSPRLPALRTIKRSMEHRPYTAGAREEDELIAIKGPDGRVVELTTGHWIFP